MKSTRWGIYVVALMVLIYIISMSYLSILRFDSFNANAFDMGIMTQTIWNMSHGRFFEESINIGAPTSRFWVAHWEFIYLPVTLVYMIFNSPETLLIIQTIVLAMGAFAVYLLANEKLKHAFAAVCFAGAYLLYPAMQNANLCDIHGLAFSTSLLSFTFYFLLKKNLKLFGLFAFLALLCREDVSLILFMYSLYAFFIMKERKLGVYTGLLSVLWFALFFKRSAIRSMLGLPPIIFHVDTPSHWEHLNAVLDNPLYLVNFLAKKYNIWYMVNLFGPVGFFSFFSLTTVVLMAPTFTINMLSDWYFAHGIEHVYTSTLTPIVFISAIFGFSNIVKFIEKKKLRSKKAASFKIDKLMYGVGLCVLLLSILFFVTRSNALKVAGYEVTEHHKTIDRVIGQIPEDASLSADVYLSSHTSERREMYVFPDNMASADFVLYDFHAPIFAMYTREDFFLEHSLPLNPYIRKMLQNPQYGIVHFDDGVILFERGKDYTEGIKKLVETNEASIQHAADIELNEKLAFKGYDAPKIMNLWFPDTAGTNGLSWKKLVRLTLYWQARSTVDDSLSICLKLSNGTIDVYQQHAPAFGTYPLSQWEVNHLICDCAFIEIPSESPAGEYQLDAALLNESADRKAAEYVTLFRLKIE
ncbi:DUF2079 domain-containing protein [candidate division KSB1 bacterium]|nr:DUF2079 domain-containing protein [candidate division KSB1 bacterium]